MLRSTLDVIHHSKIKEPLLVPRYEIVGQHPSLLMSQGNKDSLDKLKLLRKTI